MPLKNTPRQFGLIAKILHWVSALVVIALFALGYWMVDLTYYSNWYQTAPHYHKSVGILIVLVTGLRLVWRLSNVEPEPLPTHTSFERFASRWVHRAIYLCILIMFISGYLISTIKGVGIEVFNWFTVPSVYQGPSEISDIAGEVHEIAAYTLIGLAMLHALAAIKHHVIDKDDTLRRMTSLGKDSR